VLSCQRNQSEPTVTRCRCSVFPDKDVHAFRGRKFYRERHRSCSAAKSSRSSGSPGRDPQQPVPGPATRLRPDNVWSAAAALAQTLPQPCAAPRGRVTRIRSISGARRQRVDCDRHGRRLLVSIQCRLQTGVNRVAPATQLERCPGTGRAFNSLGMPQKLDRLKRLEYACQASSDEGV